MRALAMPILLILASCAHAPLKRPTNPQECEALRREVWEAAFADYARRHGAKATEEEVRECAVKMQAAVDRKWDPKDGPRPAPFLDLEFARAAVGAWKRDVAMYEDLGGRLIFQQLGLEPIDAWKTVITRYVGEQTDPDVRRCVFGYFDQKFLDAGEEATKKFRAGAPLCNL